MGATRTPREGRETPTSGALEDRFRREGLVPRRWGNGAGDTYAWHAHPYHKVLYCLRGDIVFHTRDGDLSLGPGDRLDIEPGTEHGATVGRHGVECAEASRAA